MVFIDKFTILKLVVINFFIKYKAAIFNVLVVLTSVVCFYDFCETIMDFGTIQPLWDSFGDPRDYLIQSRLSLFSKDFYFPIPGRWFSPRPFTVPLFYKIAGSDPETIVVMQKVIHCIFVFVFVNSILYIIKSKIVQIIVLPFLYYFFTWWAIVGFTENLLSESLSMSFLFLWLACIILCIRFKNKFALIVLIVISLLFSFTRDTWPYIILPAYVLLFGLFYKTDKRLKKYFFIMILFSIMVFLFQSHAANVGERYKIPVYNSLAIRVSKTPEYIAWFKNRGMPLTDSLVLNLSQVDPDKPESLIKLYNSYGNSTYEPVWKWIIDKGRNSYTWFMLSHPSYFFLQDQSDIELQRIFEIIKIGYILKVPANYLNVEKTFPYFSLEYLLWITVILIILFFIIKKPLNYWLLIPALLIILFTANTYVCYNADTLEVKRHLFITQIMIQLISILATALIADVVTCQLIILSKAAIQKYKR